MYIFFHFIYQVIKQLKFNYDYIEVRDGEYLKLSSRAFVACPFSEDDFGVISPRCYQDYLVSSVCDGGYFSTSVLNSFPDLMERVAFLNKFFQCLLCHQLPHKVQILVVVGPCDSGKSSWANVLMAFIPQSKVAVLTKEKNFGASMIEDDTQLLYVDEWCKSMMAQDQVKTSVSVLSSCSQKANK